MAAGAKEIRSAPNRPAFARTDEARQEKVGQLLREFRLQNGLSIAKIAAKARVSPNSWDDIEKARVTPAPRNKGDYSRKKKGAIRTASRILGYFIDNAVDTKLSGLAEGLEMLGFDLKDPDVKSAIETRPPQAESAQAVATAATLIEHEEVVRVGISRFAPFGLPLGSAESEQSAAENTLSWPLVNAIIGAVGRPLDIKKTNTSFVEGKIVAQIDAALSEFKTKNDYQVLFGIADTPSRRFQGTTAINLPGLSFSLGLLCSRDAAAGWRSFLETVITGKGDDISYFALRSEAGFDFLAGLCRVAPVHIKTYPFEDLSNGALTRELLRTRLQGRKVAFVGDATICFELRAKLQSDATKDIFDEFEIHPKRDFSSGDSEIDGFPIPRFKAGFILRKNDQLAELLESCLTGELFPIFSAVLAIHYARFLADSMFLRSSMMQHIILDQLPDSIGTLEKKRFADACRHALQAQAPDKKVRNLIEQQICRTWLNDGSSANAEGSP